VDAFQVVRDFERALCEYTGAPFAVTTNSCTMALMLAMVRYRQLGGTYVIIPSRTYPSVPMSAHHAGLDISFIDVDWQETEPRIYNLYPSPIWDFAKRLTSGMYIKGQVQCISLHIAKNLKVGQGGAILHDDPEADEWYRRARFDGRKEGVATKDDDFSVCGFHCYLSPPEAARGLWLLSSYPKDVPDQCAHDYPNMEGWNWK
jgi:dTDP-4-amino-4,6-dideoxygalactose transaminase